MAKPDTLTLDIIVDDPAWQDLAAGLEGDLRRAIDAGLACAGLFEPVEISVLLTGDGRQQKLNAEHRKRDHPTNVLSFPQDSVPLPGEIRYLGDISLAHGIVAEEAAVEGKKITDHTAHLAIHGLFHLLGYDHEDSASAAQMEALEVAALARLGIADPYQVAQNSTGDA
jgi:probable rRNA maturation factor